MPTRLTASTSVIRKKYVPIAIGIVGIFFCIYKLKDADFATLWQQLHTAHFGFLVATLLLLPANLFLEVGKWQFMLRDIESITYKQAWQQVLWGICGSFITPYKVGDYPARASLIQDKSKWASVITMGFLGSFIQNVMIAMVGIPAIFLFIQRTHNEVIATDTMLLVSGISLVVCLCLPFLLKLLGKVRCKSSTMNKLIADLQQLSFQKMAKILLLCVARYGVWGLQLYLLVRFFGAELALQDAFIAIPTYYLLVTFTPFIPAFDVAIRGSWSFIVFVPFIGNTAIIGCVVLAIYLINTIIPFFVGLFIHYHYEN